MKRLVAGILAIVLLLACCGCMGNKGNGRTGEEDPLSHASVTAPPEGGSQEEAPLSQPAADSSPQGGSQEVDPESFFDDALFIGDSRTEALMLYGGLDKAEFCVFNGKTIDQILDGCEGKTPDGKKTLAKVLDSETFGKIYISLGVNEMGWVYPEVLTEDYEKLIAQVQEAEPDAQIYIQSIFPFTQRKSDDGSYLTNQKADEFNALFKDMAERLNLPYLNVREAIEDENGCLPPDCTKDGVHINKELCKKWINYLLLQAQDK